MCGPLALPDVGDDVHVLQFPGHLEGAVDEPSELVELVPRQVAQVKPFDLLLEVHLPSVCGRGGGRDEHAIGG